MLVRVIVALSPKSTLWGLTELKMEMLVQTAPIFVLATLWPRLRAKPAIGGMLIGLVIAIGGVDVSTGLSLAESIVLVGARDGVRTDDVVGPATTHRQRGPNTQPPAPARAACCPGDGEFASRRRYLCYAEGGATLGDVLGALRHSLARLAEAGRIDVQNATALSQAYETLRTIEHRVQMIDDRQTHQLPKGEGLDRVAQLHGLSDGANLVAMLAPVTEQVGRL